MHIDKNGILEEMSFTLEKILRVINKRFKLLQNYTF